MSRYVDPQSDYIAVADLQFAHVEADDAAELETKVRALFAEIEALAGPGINAIWLAGSGNVSPRKHDGQFVCCVEYSSSGSPLGADNTRVYCYGGKNYTELDAARTQAYARATTDSYTRTRDMLLAGSSSRQPRPRHDKFIGMLVCIEEPA